MNLFYGKFGNTFRSLRNRNYRTFFFGHGLSRIGLHMQRMALGWLVYEITGSPFLLGIVSFSREICVALLAPFAGVAADRWDRKSALLLCQLLFAVQSAAIAVLVWTEAVATVHIVLLSVLHGIISAFEIPIRQSFLIDLVREKKELGNAIGLSSSVFNAAMLAGPAAGGFIIASFGEAAAFFICALTYLGMLAALFRIRSAQRLEERKPCAVFHELKRGVSYAADFVPVRYLLLLVGITGFAALPYITLMLVVVREIITGGAETLGILMGSAGFGALAGAIFLASRKSALGLGKVIALSTLMLGAGLIGFSQAGGLLLSSLLVCFVGFGAIVQRSSANIILQTISADDRRGRVISLYVVVLTSMRAAGDLAAGFAADNIGVSNTLIIGGAICLFCAYAAYRKLPYIRKFVHPVYRSQGIIENPG